MGLCKLKNVSNMEACTESEKDDYRKCEAERRDLGLRNQRARDEFDRLRHFTTGMPMPVRGKGTGTDHVIDDVTFLENVERRIDAACVGESAKGLEAKMNTCETKRRQKLAALGAMRRKIDAMENYRVNSMGYTFLQ